MWLVFALATIIFYTATALLTRLFAVRAKDIRTFSFLYSLSGFILLLIVALIFADIEVQLDGYLTVLLILTGVSYGLFQRFHFVVRRHVEVSRLQTIIAPSSIVGYVLAVIWLNEAVPAVRLFGYALLIISAAFIVDYRKQLNFNKYALLGFLGGACLSVAGTIDKRVSPNFSSAVVYTAYIWLAQSIVVYFPYINKSKVISEFKLHSWKIPIIASVNIIGTYFMISAIRLAPATQVQPVVSANVVTIALAGIIFLNERERVGAKLTASAIAFIGLFLVSR
jgi:drug/metabolite transporter (DMT)-like permease